MIFFPSSTHHYHPLNLVKLSPVAKALRNRALGRVPFQNFSYTIHHEQILAYFQIPK